MGMGNKIIVGLVNKGVKKFDKTFMKETKYKSDDWEYNVQVDFFGLNGHKPEMRNEDVLGGNVEMFNKRMEIEEWNMKVKAFEKFTGKKFKG